MNLTSRFNLVPRFDLCDPMHSERRHVDSSANLLLAAGESWHRPWSSKCLVEGSVAQESPELLHRPERPPENSTRRRRDLDIIPPAEPTTFRASASRCGGRPACLVGLVPCMGMTRPLVRADQCGMRASDPSDSEGRWTAARAGHRRATATGDACMDGCMGDDAYRQGR